MRNGTKKKMGAIAAALAVAGVMLLVMAAAGAGLIGQGNTDLLAAAILGLYTLLGLAVLLGVIAALGQRLREIRGGEEEDAKKY